MNSSSAFPFAHNKVISSTQARQQVNFLRKLNKINGHFLDNGNSNSQTLHLLVLKEGNTNTRLRRVETFNSKGELKESFMVYVIQLESDSIKFPLKGHLNGYIVATEIPNIFA